jgi:hypothetical protein
LGETSTAPMKNYVLFLSACLLLFSTACTVNKRAHRPGYNVEWHSANPQPKKHPKLEEQESTSGWENEFNQEVAIADTEEALSSTEQIEAGSILGEDNTIAGGESSTGILAKEFKIGKSNLGDSNSEKPESELRVEAPQQRNSQADNLAVWGFVTSLAGFFLVPVLGSIAGVVLSAVALNKMRDNPTAHRQRGLAIAGLVIGIVGLAFWTGYIFLLILML